MNIVRMSTRQWYLYLMDREIFKKTMSDGSQENNLCRIERNSPDFDWTLTWEKIRLPLLPSDAVSFLWKLIHEILPTEERINSTVGNIPATCRHCCEDQHVADQIHCFQLRQHLYKSQCPSVCLSVGLSVCRSASNEFYRSVMLLVVYIRVSRIYNFVEFHLGQFTSPVAVKNKLPQEISDFLIQEMSGILLQMHCCTVILATLLT